jgi:pyruvate-formate lyase-activating enzyme
MNVKDPFRLIYDSEAYRNTHEHPLPRVPYFLDVELTNACDLGCIMCAREIMERGVGFMDYALFQSIVDQSAEAGVAAIRFSGLGEALLHKKLFEAIRYAKNAGLLVHLTSNGKTLDEEKARKLLDSGLDRVKFSFQGTEKNEYERMRKGGNFEQLVENIRRLIRLREEGGYGRPFVQIGTTTIDETPEQIARFLGPWRELADDAYALKTHFYRMADTETGREHMPRQQSEIRKTLCVETRTKMTIYWTGQCSACCGDFNGWMIMGDLRNDRLVDIWNGTAYGRVRGVLSQVAPINLDSAQRRQLPLCAMCTMVF